jgi:hypothetical protein
MHVNYDKIKEQFAEAKIKVGVGKAVLKMLETWESIDMPPEMAKEALEILAKVGMGYSITPEKKDEVWVDAMRGQMTVGDQVRLKADAFNGEKGHLYNGRRCVITAVRSGDIIVNSTDGKQPSIDGAHFQPENLQKRVR